jgi:hypothetical protein
MAKNTTLARKPANTMSKNEGFDMPKRRSDQSGDGADFAFNGQMGDGVNREANRWAGNQVGLTMRENYGMSAAARKGNASDSIQERREQTGPSVTRDPVKKTISTAAEGHNIGRETTARRFANPDSIYMGK